MKEDEKKSKIIEDFRDVCLKTIENILIELELLNIPIEYLKINDPYSQTNIKIPIMEIEIFGDQESCYIFAISDDGIYIELEDLETEELSILTDRVLNFYLQKTGKDYKFNTR